MALDRGLRGDEGRNAADRAELDPPGRAAGAPRGAGLPHSANGRAPAPSRRGAGGGPVSEAEAWQETVGEGPWRVTAIERHWKGGALYLRWRERRDDGRTDWRYRSL